MKKIAIIVPCYNEEETINIFYDEIIKHTNIDGYEFRFIFVNDGSKDKSLDIMHELSNKDSRVLYVSFSRNFGKEAAMFAGLEAAHKIKADAAIPMDVDLQDPPTLIPELIKEYENGYNLVITKHRNRNGESKLKAFCALAFYKIYAFVTKDKNLARGARDFALLDQKVIEAFLMIRDYERFTKGIYHYVGFKTKIIEFDYVPRVAGETKWSFKKLFHYAIMGMRQFSRFYEYIPKIFGWLFFLLMLADIGWNIYLSVTNNTPYNYYLTAFYFGLTCVFVTLFYMTRLTYDNRKILQKRPIYITEDSNLQNEIEKNA